MGPYTTILPNEIGHGTILGRSFRTQIMGSRMPDLPYDFTSISTSNHEQIQNPTASKFWENTWISQKCAKTKMIAMPRSIDLKTSSDPFSLKKWAMSRNRETVRFWLSILISESASSWVEPQWLGGTLVVSWNPSSRTSAAGQVQLAIKISSDQQLL